MAKTRNTEPEAVEPGDETGEETEPEPFLGTEEAEDNTQVNDAGVPGQIEYPERVVDAERAGEFAAGKVDTLEPEDEDEGEGEDSDEDE
jgi:hypothetical protein